MMHSRGIRQFSPGRDEPQLVTDFSGRPENGTGTLRVDSVRMKRSWHQ